MIIIPALFKKKPLFDHNSYMFGAIFRSSVGSFSSSGGKGAIYHMNSELSTGTVNDREA